MTNREQDVLFAEKTTAQATSRPPYIIYQMGKVGSSTLYTTLQKSLPETDVYHVHTLDYETIGRNVVTHPNWEEVRHIKDSIVVRRRLEKHLKKPVGQAGEPWRLITPVREPISRNLSGFFFNHTKYIPDMINRYESGSLRLNDIRDVFLKKYSHAIPVRWFEREYKAQFGIDVYALPFDREKGFTFFHSDRINILLLQSEVINDFPVDLMETFLGCEFRDRLGQKGKNSGSTKPYSKVYADFKAKVRFPREFVDAMYGSPYMRHFYTEAQISQFRTKFSE